MTVNETRKVTVRRTRRSVQGNIVVKHRRTNSTKHVVDLNQPPIIDEPESEIISHQSDSDPVVFYNKSWPFNFYRKVALSFIVLAVVILGVVAYFAMVRLDIKVKSSIMPVEAEATFSIYDRPTNFSLPANSILGIVREMEIEYQTMYPTTGGEVTGAEITGRVTIINNYSKDQPLVATTRLLTKNNQLLRLKETVLVPAGGSIEVEVYGDTVDPSFTLADSTLTIPGLWAGLQDKIYAQAKAGAVNYKEIRKSIVVQADLDKALASAKQALVEKASSEIESVYASYDKKLYEVKDDSMAFSFDAKVGEEKSNIGITMTGQVVVIAFKQSDLINLDQTILQSGLKTNQSLIDDNISQSDFKVSQVDTVDNVAEVKLSVAGSSKVKSVEELIDRKKLIGLTEEQLRSYLDSLEGVGSYELTFKPSFLKIAPQLIDRITITVDN